MTNPNFTTIITQLQAGLRRNVALVANGVAGASIIAVLSVTSVITPAVVGGVSLATLLTWLGSLGGKALAEWLNTACSAANEAPVC